MNHASLLFVCIIIIKISHTQVVGASFCKGQKSFAFSAPKAFRIPQTGDGVGVGGTMLHYLVAQKQRGRGPLPQPTSPKGNHTSQKLVTGGRPRAGSTSQHRMTRVSGPIAKAKSKGRYHGQHLDSSKQGADNLTYWLSTLGSTF